MEIASKCPESSVEEGRSRHGEKDLWFMCSEKFLVQVYVIAGEKNIIKRLVVLSFWSLLLASVI